MAKKVHGMFVIADEYFGYEKAFKILRKPLG